ncbi:hypothetical protein LB503_013024 [Fusarium chuoi]|nr:hypothetical protein LB503_013024 [Fusarium chuoi]
MNKFSVLAPPSLENVEAFLLGAIYAIEVSQPMLAWQLVSSAAGTCQTLGWHQLVPHSDSTTDRKISLFWLTYLLDKGLSLRLGRPAVIHDAEITLPECLDKADICFPNGSVILDLSVGPIRICTVHLLFERPHRNVVSVQEA